MQRKSETKDQSTIPVSVIVEKDQLHENYIAQVTDGKLFLFEPTTTSKTKVNSSRYYN